MSTRWQGPELEVARRPARPTAKPGIGARTILGWLIADAIVCLPIIGLVLAVRWAW